MLSRISFTAALATLFISLFISPTWGQVPVYYIDADSASDALVATSTGANDLPDPFVAGNTRIDDSEIAFDPWRIRDFGIGGDLYQYRSTEVINEGDPDPQGLITTIDGSHPQLQNGTTYNIYAFFWDDFVSNEPENDAWFVDASLNGTSFTTFTAGNGTPGPGVTEAALLPFGNLSDVNTTSDLSITSPGVQLINSLTPGTANDRVFSDGSSVNTDLYAALVGTTTANGADIDVFIRNQSAGNRVWYDGVGFQEANTIVGDANNDQVVDIDDFNDEILPDFLTAQTPGEGGDVFGDGFVDLRDFSVWQQNRSDRPGQLGASQAVPEPNCLALIASALSLLGVRRNGLRMTVS